MEANQESSAFAEELATKRREAAAVGHIRTLLLRLQATVQGAGPHLQDALVHSWRLCAPCPSKPDLLEALQILAGAAFADQLVTAVEKVNNCPSWFFQCLVPEQFKEDQITDMCLGF